MLIGTKVERIKTGEIGTVINWTSKTVTLRLEDRRRLSLRHQAVRRYRQPRCRIPARDDGRTTLAKNSNLTVAQVRNACR